VTELEGSDDMSGKHGESVAATRRLLVVVGMHRSGTSATTGALQCLGVSLGARLYAGQAGINPKGYFEHSDIADANDEALLSIGSGWDDILPRPDGWWLDPSLAPHGERLRGIVGREIDKAPLFAVKDPRVCRLLAWWHTWLQADGVAPVYLFVVRAPAQVCGSLQRRDGFSAAKSQLLWLHHYLEAERATRGRTRAFLDFSRFLADPVAEFARVQDTLGFAFPRSPGAASADLRGFISADLRHHAGDGAGDRSPYADLAARLDAALRGAAQPGGQLDTTEVDAIDDALQARLATLPDVAVEQLRDLGRKRGTFELTVNRLIRSWSYVVGKPVRVVERALGRNV